MNNLSRYTFISGGARGADQYWEYALKTTLGSPNIIVYRPEHIVQMKTRNKDQYLILEKQYREVVKTLHRHVLSDETYAGQLVRRDMLQVAHADSVYAIAPIDKNGYIKGGTGYATTRAIQMKLNVYDFDDSIESWYKWNYESKRFEIYDDDWYKQGYELHPEFYDGVPLLSENSCCVGSRDLSEKGKQAINSCVLKLKKYLMI